MEDGFQAWKKTAKASSKARSSNEMDVDEAEMRKSYFDAPWQDSPDLEDSDEETEELKCYECDASCRNRCHRR